MISAESSSYAVRFSDKVARVLDCVGPFGTVSFTIDSGSKGDNSICLEHHPSTSHRPLDYRRAFEAAKHFLESCGYEVEIYGQ